MQIKRIGLAAAIVALVILIGFALSVPHTRDLGANSKNSGSTALPLVYLHDVYKKGVHSITGKVALPTPCTNLAATSAVQSGTPDLITLALEMPSDTGVCLSQTATTTFTVTSTAGSDARITATINGTVASTSIY